MLNESCRWQSMNHFVLDAALDCYFGGALPYTISNYVVCSCWYYECGCSVLYAVSGTHTHRKTLPRSKQSRGERHASSSTSLGTPSVNNMLEALGWPTLEQRRQTCRLLMLYKIQSGLAHCPTLKAKLVPLPSRQRLTHDKQLTLLTTRTQYRGSSFLPKTIKDWNSLPMKVVEAPTLDAFESRVSNWKTTYRIPTHPPRPPRPHPTPWLPTSAILIFFLSDQYYSEHPQL